MKQSGVTFDFESFVKQSTGADWSRRDYSYSNNTSQ